MSDSWREAAHLLVKAVPRSTGTTIHHNNNGSSTLRMTTPSLGSVAGRHRPVEWFSAVAFSDLAERFENELVVLVVV